MRFPWIVLLLAFTGAAAWAQTPMDGVWNNVDARTGGVVQVRVQGRRMHPYGRCHPELCDWGSIKGKMADDASRLTAVMHDRMGKREIELVLGGDGVLRMRVSTVYADGRFGPGDHHEEWVFRRVSGPASK